MKSPYVAELQPNQICTATLLVLQKDIRQKKTGEPYLSLMLGDRTGEIEAKMWDNVAEVMDTFERDEYLKVRGMVQIYQNRMQLTVHKLQKQTEDSVDATDFFPASARDPEEMLGEVRAIVAGMSNPHLKALLTAVFSDEGIARKYKLAPAAKSVHHAYLGGLIEHVLSMCGVARLLASHYRNVDVDLLLAGVLLHDLGKIEELTWHRSFGYSSEGQLLGHISICLRMIADKLHGIPDFPPRLRALLEHMILSHHGELQFGSPKTPQFAEALLLHHIDNLDSKMECIRSFVERDRQVDGCWTGYNSALERPLLKKQKYLDGEDARPQAVAGNGTAPAEPARVPAEPVRVSAEPQRVPAEPQRVPGRAPLSTAFAEKLQSALKKEV